MQKVLGPIRRVRFTQSTLRQASIQEKKGPSLGKVQVKNPHQRSSHAIQFEDRSQEETERPQRCARSKAWNFAKNIYKKKDKSYTLLARGRMEYSRLRQQKSRGKRVCVVFRSSYAHGQQERDLNSDELETMRISRSPTMVMTANGEATENVKELDLFVTVMLLEETLAVLPLGKLCENHGCIYHWTSCQKPHLTQNGKRIDCKKSNHVPFVVLGLSRSSSTTPTPTSSTSSSQDSVFDVSRYTENPVPERSGSTSEELRGNPLHGSTETENTNKNEGREDVQSDLLHELPDWLQEFRENLVDESSPLAPKDQDTFSSSGVASKSGTGLGQAQYFFHSRQKDYIT